MYTEQFFLDKRKQDTSRKQLYMYMRSEKQVHNISACSSLELKHYIGVIIIIIMITNQLQLVIPN